MSLRHLLLLAASFGFAGVKRKDGWMFAAGASALAVAYALASPSGGAWVVAIVMVALLWGTWSASRLWRLHEPIGGRRTRGG